MEHLTVGQVIGLNFRHGNHEAQSLHGHPPEADGCGIILFQNTAIGGIECLAAGRFIPDQNIGKDDLQGDAGGFFARNGKGGGVDRIDVIAPHLHMQSVFAIPRMIGQADARHTPLPLDRGAGHRGGFLFDGLVTRGEAEVEHLTQAKRGADDGERARCQGGLE